MSHCVCKDPSSVEYDDRIKTLDSLRSKCPALSKLLIPDTVWAKVQTFESSSRDAAYHVPTTVNALLNGHLARITSPIHRFLLDGENIRPEVTALYKDQLQERWMFETNELERHKKSRMFQGRIAELQIAEWLENQNWEITALEALGADVDIAGIRPLSFETSVEVKFIGQRDEEFQEVVKSLSGAPSVAMGPGYEACNYLIFRTYEAALKLASKSARRVALIAIEDLACTFFRIPLKHKWIHWHNPSFYKLTTRWDSFLQEQKKRYPMIDSDLKTVISSLDELWIVFRGEGYTYSTKFHYLFPKRGAT